MAVNVLSYEICSCKHKERKVTAVTWFMISKCDSSAGSTAGTKLTNHRDFLRS